MRTSLETYAPEWDYTAQADYYRFRPNYAREAITSLCERAGARGRGPDFLAADIGAGTGNLALLLAEQGVRCVAIEPNDAMRRLGVAQTSGLPIEWRAGTAERTTLGTASVHLYAMGSSFNTTDQPLTLQEAHRVLVPGGHFSCLWNHRDLDDPMQREVEAIIRSVIPAYTHGSRRQDQTAAIEASGSFRVVASTEHPQTVRQSFEQYLTAWRSVRNAFWDLRTEDGRRCFDEVERRIRQRFGRVDEVVQTYTTRMWVAVRLESGSARGAGCDGA